MGVACEGPGGYAQLIENSVRGRSTDCHRGKICDRILPWPSLRRSYIDCAASFARRLAEPSKVSMTCSEASAVSKGCWNDFRICCAQLQAVTTHGRAGNFIHGFVVAPTNFHNFSGPSFVKGLQTPCPCATGVNEWISDGMVCDHQCRPPDGWRRPPWMYADGEDLGS